MWKTDSRGKDGGRGPVRRPLQVSVSDDGGGSEDSEEKDQILNTFRTKSRKNLLMNYNMCERMGEGILLFQHKRRFFKDAFWEPWMLV